MRGRIVRSFGADALGQMLNVGARLALVPLFLSAWGAEAYGEWLILTALAAWFALGDLGGQLYFVNRLTSEWAVGKIEDFQRVYSTGLLFFIASSCLLFVIVFLTVFLLPASVWGGFNNIDLETAKAILLLMALRFSISLPVGLLLGVYRSIGLQATSVMYGNLIALIHLIASFFALISGGGMLLLASLEVLPFILIIPILIWDLRRRMPREFRLIALDRSDRSIMISAISPSLHFLSLQLSAAIIIQGSVLVIAKVLGPVEVAIFTSMRIVANVMSRFMWSISHAAWPEITRLSAMGERDKLTKIFREILFITLSIGVCYLVFVVHFGEALYRWWLNDELPFDFTIMYLLSVQVIMGVMWAWGGNILMATNQHKEYANCQILINLVALSLSYLGLVNFGLLGGVAGLIVGQTLPMFIIVIWLLARMGWVHISRALLITSLVGLLLMFMTLNVWGVFLEMPFLLLYLIYKVKAIKINDFLKRVK